MNAYARRQSRPECREPRNEKGRQKNATTTGPSRTWKTDSNARKSSKLSQRVRRALFKSATLSSPSYRASQKGSAGNNARTAQETRLVLEPGLEGDTNLDFPGHAVSAWETDRLRGRTATRQRMKTPATRMLLVRRWALAEPSDNTCALGPCEQTPARTSLGPTPKSHRFPHGAAHQTKDSARRCPNGFTFVDDFAGRRHRGPEDRCCALRHPDHSANR